VTQDYYAALGLSPSSEDVVIRAAYVALMRRYHPDGNPTAAAAARTRAINAAYAVLSDPDKRAEYDSMRSAEVWGKAPAQWSRPLPSGIFAAAAIALLMLTLLLFIRSPPPLPMAPDRQAQTRSRETAAALKPDPVRAAEKPAVRRHATEEEAANPPLPVAKPAPSPSPPPHAALPPVPAQKLPKPTPRLAARLRPAPAPSPPPKARPAALAKALQPKAPQPAASQPAPAKAAAAPRKPSFSCRVARTRGEIAVCKSGNLSNLDRQQALLYSQSWGRADAAKRAQLLSTREHFMARRDSCRTVECTSAAYLARVREVSEIMIGQAKPPN
jgi:hypothetical protein